MEWFLKTNLVTLRWFLEAQKFKFMDENGMSLSMQVKNS